MGIEQRLPRIRLTATPPKPVDSGTGLSRPEPRIGWVAMLEAKISDLEARIVQLEASALSQAAARPIISLNDILAESCAEFGVAQEAVIGIRRSPAARAVKLAFVAKARWAGFTFEDMATALKVSTNALRVQVARNRRARQ